MESWNMILFWAAVGINAVASVWNIVSAIRYDRKADRLDRETYKERPVIPGEKMAILRPGDTGILLCRLDGMTLKQQEQYVESIRGIMLNVKERGVELIVIPEFGDAKMIIVNRGELAECADNGGHDNDDGGNSSPHGKQSG